MSSSEGRDFENWIGSTFARTDGFTALIMLLAMSNERIRLLSCSYVHVVGDEVSWRDMRSMLDASQHHWDAFVIFPEVTPGGGPVIDLVAKARLQDRIDEVTVNRMVINEGGLFDIKGMAIRIDPVEDP